MCYLSCLSALFAQGRIAWGEGVFLCIYASYFLCHLLNFIDGVNGKKKGSFLCFFRLFFVYLVKFGQKWAENWHFFAGVFSL
ncbi:hypothetical protein EZS27_044060 [termite gut metagenome]|uniref:Uncharacterized protein n=1 Tax=termite gut metagenome TaxID=433724 RepID=A0A5J4P6H2_9ZZZZ